MSPLDFVVLIGTMVGIAVYGIWRTRGQRDLSTYLKGDPNVRWAAIGISVMATQASAITFISTPGQGYQDGLGFVQNYFGMPLALIIIAAIFLPMYRRLNVYTAYEFLGRRFDAKTRLLGAALFPCSAGLPPESRSTRRPSSSPPCWVGGWISPSSSAGCWSSFTPWPVAAKR